MNESSRPAVFISHDARDAELAKAFALLLEKSSRGELKVYRSSDQKGGGPEFGDDWNNWIMDKLADSSDVIALFTKRSLGRPWILYEAGIAKGKSGKKVMGLALGVSVDQVSAGPFAQFHNIDYNEDSITSFVLQLVRKCPDVSPQEENIRGNVRSFRQQVDAVLPHGVCDGMNEAELIDYLLDTHPLRDEREVRRRSEASENMIIKFFLRHHQDAYVEALKACKSDVLPLPSGPRMEAAREAIARAVEGVRAVSVLGKDPWHELGGAYQKANIEAAKNGRRIRRVLMVDKKSALSRPGVKEIICEQLEVGIELRWAITRQVERRLTNLYGSEFRVVNVLISDDKIMTRSTYLANHGGKLFLKSNVIRNECSRFDELWISLRDQVVDVDCGGILASGAEE